MKPPIVLFLFTFLFTSCDDVHIANRTFKSGNITVNWYKISTITTIHDYVDLERYGRTDNIMKANTDGVYDIKIDNDTITIQIVTGLLVYDLAALKEGCYIKLDSSVTEYEYDKKYHPKMH